MLQITDAQLRDIGASSFVARMRATLLQQYPQDAQAIQSDSFAPAVEALVQQAAIYGLADEQSAAIFVFTAWLLGADFVEQFPEIKPLLNQEDLLPAQKAAGLEAFALSLLQQMDESAARSVDAS